MWTFAVLSDLLIWNRFVQIDYALTDFLSIFDCTLNIYILISFLKYYAFPGRVAYAPYMSMPHTDYQTCSLCRWRLDSFEILFQRNYDVS